jgi:PAS domain S-box-containing protein
MQSSHEQNRQKEEPQEQLTRQEAEQALRLSEERYRDLVENANDVIYAHDLSGNLTTWNRAGEQLLGYARNEALSMNIAQLIVPEQLARARQMIARKIAEGGRTTYELDVLTKDGRRLTMEISSRIAAQPGQALQVQGMARDITERKRAEQALQDADRRKNEFLATLAHELRNPLAPIRNSLHILRMSGEVGPVVERVCEMMERQVGHLVRLVDDLLEVSRITRGAIELRKERVALASILRNAVDTSRPLIEASHHNLAISIPPEPFMVEVDPVRLGQVIANLLNNAAKYTVEGGQIQLTARRQGDWALISVRDNGVGIPAEMLPRVFEMFAQVDRTLKRAQGGLGIGLTLARNLVHLHGGQIEAFSEGLGHGSEFVVRLPLADQSSHEATDAPKEALRSAAVVPINYILVVDDNRDAADSLAMLLRCQGHQVQVAHDGPAALEAVKVKRPEIVLLDIGMPGMDGYDVARAFRNAPEYRNLTLIAVTGWGQEEDRRKAQESGFDYHLTKPVNLEALQLALSRVHTSY